ncbi:hypothetical protein GJ744_004741 [Endocarpon pusillum]|uniref:Heterokaryon incompatibility domain-containing protein n=1 Tax=Endocarpon pusillum TaxID=364733 RepID=A0A8H7DYS4_9EURO|nr:hypothetical protein GJ744_004741 [Endocarpon pusillum]
MPPLTKKKQKDSAGREENVNPYLKTGPNRISYWAGIRSFGSAILPYEDGETNVTAHCNELPAEEFKYGTSLKTEEGEIRLLHLFPGLEGDPVRCELRRAFLKDDPAYLALSYCWDELPGMKPILVDSCRMNVRANLAAALEQLRSHTRKTLVLWIDAVCINQSTEDDNLEKDAQVNQMHLIYTQAALVIGWLGPAQDYSDEAVILMDWVAKEAAVRSHGKNDFGKDDFDHQEQEILSELLVKYAGSQRIDLIIQSIGALFTRKWWFRVWIMQEVQLAKDVLMVCGDFGIPLDYLRRAFDAIARLGYTTKLGEMHSDTAKAVRRHITFTPPKMLSATSPQKLNLPVMSRGLEDIIAESNGLNATDPRDHIFALRSMANDFKELEVQVDYHKTIADVFTDTAKTLIKKRGALYILSWCQKTPAEVVFRKDLAKLPSWVPNWSSKFPQPIWMRLKNNYSLFSASGNPIGGSTPTPQFDGNVLKIAGHDFDVVKTISKQSWNHGTGTDKRFVVTMCIWEAKQLLGANWRKEYTTKTGHEIVLRTLVADTDLKLPNFEPVSANTRKLGRTFDAVIEQMKKQDPGILDEDFLAQRDHLYKLIARIFHGRTLFVTSRGYLGVGDERVKEGDKVCIFLGAPVPFILRDNGTKLGDGTKLNQLVGECYVHDIMYGGALYGNPATVTFAIR